MAEIRQLRERAEHWRTMIRQTTDAKAIDVMTAMAEEIDAEIDRVEATGITTEFNGTAPRRPSAST
jgi:hypothetical protein